MHRQTCVVARTHASDDDEYVRCDAQQRALRVRLGGKTALLFAGQGAQQVGMGVHEADINPAARALFDRASHVLGYDLYELCKVGACVAFVAISRCFINVV